MNKILIANRGEIALRIMDTCKRLNIQTVAVYSEPDRDALHVASADEAHYIGPAPVDQSYLNAENILAAARDSGADGIHPGYGFLSENAAFAAAVEAQGLVWIGPPKDAMASMASKISARTIAIEHEVPVVPASTLNAGAEPDVAAIIEATGLPLLIKSSAGGGGIGMREVYKAEDLAEAIVEARAQAQRQFGCADLLIERLISDGRHIEVQVVADQFGNHLHLFERDCSSQRRRQKILEESPAPGLSDALRCELQDAALRLAKAVAYRGVGTVEFLVDDDAFYLLEMNTRLQVEHGVTEAVTGLDLVELQIRVARGEELAFSQSDIQRRGHAIQARIYAEEPGKGFLPASGTVRSFAAPETGAIRLDTGIGAGSVVGHHYDGLLCKLIVHGEDRPSATLQLKRALRNLRLSGLSSNQAFLGAALNSAHWQDGMRTSTVEASLDELLKVARPTDREVAQLLVAATIFQFMSEPPAADGAAWPGAYQYQRRSLWSVDGIARTVTWHWRAAREFEFPELASKASLLNFSEEAAQITLEIDGRRQSFSFDSSPDTLWLWNGVLGNHALLPLHARSTDSSTQGEGHCVSHGPGQLLRILVTSGQMVDQGDPLVVIESMKMESTLVAQAKSTVADIPVREGDLIRSGQLLVRLHQEEES